MIRRGIKQWGLQTDLYVGPSPTSVPLGPYFPPCACRNSNACDAHGTRGHPVPFSFISVSIVPARFVCLMFSFTGGTRSDFIENRREGGISGWW